MSQQYDNTNRGFAMLNTKKKKENSPDWTGKLDVEGAPYRLSIWKNKTKKGEPMLGIQIQHDEQGAQRERDQPPKRQRYEDDGVDLDDEIPW